MKKIQKAQQQKKKKKQPIEMSNATFFMPYKINTGKQYNKKNKKIIIKKKKNTHHKPLCKPSRCSVLISLK